MKFSDVFILLLLGAVIGIIAWGIMDTQSHRAKQGLPPEGPLTTIDSIYVHVRHIEERLDAQDLRRR